MKIRSIFRCLILSLAGYGLSAVADEDIKCHSEGTKSTIINIIFEPIINEFGESTAKDLFTRVEPEFDMIVVNSIDKDVGKTLCNAKLQFHIESLNSEEMVKNGAQRDLNAALLQASGRPAGDGLENIKAPDFKNEKESTAGWNILYSIQSTSDGSQQIVSVANAQGYIDYFRMVVKMGGLEISDKEVELVKEKNERWGMNEGQEAAEESAKEHVKPSFDCAKASSVNEKLICSDQELSSLDNELSTIYKSAKERAPDKAVFKTETVTAFKNRESSCKTKECLINWYAERKSILQKY